MSSLRSALPFGFVLVLFVTFLVIEQRNRAWELFERGRTFEQQGLIEDAAEQYEWAIQAYTPMGSVLPESIRRLEAIGQDAESAGNDPLARTAWQSIVSGLAVIEHLWQPESETLARARERLDAVEQRMMEPPRGAAETNP